MNKLIINKIVIILLLNIFVSTYGQSCKSKNIFYNKLSVFADDVIYKIDLNDTNFKKENSTTIIIEPEKLIENIFYLEDIAIELNDTLDFHGNLLKNYNFDEKLSDENDTTTPDAPVHGDGADQLGLLPARWLGALPPFDPAKSSRVSSLCKQQSASFMKALNRFDMWALKMHDASAKLPSGMLNGNVNQLGDFDQCMSASNPIGDIRGQYCLTYIEMRVPSDPPKGKFTALHRLTHSHYAFRSELEDSGHRIPRFSTINWALCVPSGCSPQDVELSLRETLQEYVKDTDVRLKVKVDQEMCQVQRDDWLKTGNIIAISFFAAIISIAIVSTIYEYNSQNPIKLLIAFSFLNNGRQLMSMKRSDTDIQSLHGIRFMNALMLYISHKSMALFYVPYVNRTDMAETLGQHWSVVSRAASLYTDPFIMLSGLLTMHSILGRLQRGQKVNVIQEYCSRLLRILPTFGALILFCTWVLPLMGSGPQWNMVITHQSDICRKSWWRNMMFIHNYFGFENMCLTHTHHVGIDTQLFFTAPLVAIMLWRWPRRTIAGLIAVATISTAARFYVTMKLGLSNYVFYGTSVKQLFATADNMYILPAHRATVYIMGLLLGAFLKSVNHVVLSKAQLRGGWFIATLSLCAAFLIPSHMGTIDYKYVPLHAANYAAFAPIAWCLAFGWVIFTAEMGYPSAISRAFSWHGFMISTRLSYAVYLTQFPIFFYNVGGGRTAEHYNFFRMMINYKEMGWTIVCSALLTVLFDFPFQNIKNILFKSNVQNIRDKSQEKTHAQ